MQNIKTKIQKLIAQGNELFSDKKFDEAIEKFQSALEISLTNKVDKQTLESLYIYLANTYWELKEIDNYIYYYEEYLKECPQGQLYVFSRLAHGYYFIDSDISVYYHDRALNCSINEYDVASKAFAAIKSHVYKQIDIKNEAEQDVECLRNALYKDAKPYNHSKRKKKKKLNIGYLSSDCYTSIMMNYILPIWENHNQKDFNFFIFNTTDEDKEDITTSRIRNLGFNIIDCTKLKTKELAETIFNNEIDILIDLGGYTHLRTFVFFYKPAPIIISYLGYLNTQGIKEIDYILTDKYTIPEDKADLYTEKPLYLDKIYHVFSFNNITQINECPYKTNNYVTFGSFNCTSKINDISLSLWTKILKNVPDSKLLIYRTNLTEKTIQKIKSKIEQEGVNLDRVIFDSTVYSPHFKAYQKADIALDTYPFNGMSIAMETALMGIPTITLSGEGMQSRGVSRLNIILGLDDLNASVENEYVEIAVRLANNKPRLEYLRNRLRNIIENSEIIQNASEFAQELEEKYTQIYKEFRKKNNKFFSFLK